MEEFRFLRSSNDEIMVYLSVIAEILGKGGNVVGGEELEELRDMLIRVKDRGRLGKVKAATLIAQYVNLIVLIYLFI